MCIRDRHKLEVFFDIETILDTLEYQREATHSEHENRTATDELNEQLTDALTSVMPPVEEIVRILREEFGLEMTYNNEIVLNWVDMVTGEVSNLDAVEIGLPALFGVETLQDLLPFANTTDLGLDMNLTGMGSIFLENTTLSDILNGIITLDMPEAGSRNITLEEFIDGEL